MSADMPITAKSSVHRNGSFTLAAMPNVIMVFPSGSWSMSCTRDYMSKIVALRQRADIAQFVCLIDASQWQLGTPEVLATLSEFNQHAVRQGMVGQWLIDGAVSAVTTQILAKALKRHVASVDVVPDIDTCLQNLSATITLPNQSEIKRVFQQYAQ